MLRHYNDTKCTLDNMRVMSRPVAETCRSGVVVRYTAVDVDGCGVARAYACVDEVTVSGGLYPITVHVCTAREPG
jgi:hypothetical protein